MKKLFLNMFLIGLAAWSADKYQEAMKAPGRSESDLARDNRSKPDEILRFAGIEEGYIIADIFGGGGYYSELLSHLVAPNGKIYLQNNQAYLPYVGKELETRLEGDRLKNVIRHDREADNLDFPAESLDMALMVMSYHDIYHQSDGWKIDGDLLFAQILKALKPGGKLLLIDHSAEKETGSISAQELHRIDEAFAKKDVQAKGFKLVGESQVLRNPNDDLTKSVFAEGIRGKTDRFVLLFVKK